MIFLSISAKILQIHKKLHMCLGHFFMFGILDTLLDAC